MKETVQKPQAPAQLQQEGGQTMAAPAFGLTASPVQAKSASNQPIQKKNNGRNPEQDQLREDFEAYRDIKSGTLTDPAAKKSFIDKANQFIAWADEKSGWFDSDQRWGNGDYQKRLRKDFSDYVLVLQGKIAEVKSVALQDANDALSIAKGAVARAQIAIDQANSNAAEAEKAALAAEEEAVKAEASATAAEANAKLPDAGEPEKAAALKAREAATAARKAADAAKKAVAAAKASSEVAESQKAFAAHMIEQAQATIITTNGISKLQDAQRQQKGNADLKQGAEKTVKAIDGNSAASTAAKTEAQTEAVNAKQQAELAKAGEMGSRPIPGLADKIKALGDATTKKDRQAKAKALMELARTEIAKYPPLVTQYKDQPTPDAAEKVRVIGELAVRAARVEWLIGSIYLEGSGDTNKWKGNGLTAAEESMLGNYYEKKVGATSGPVWCTAFMGAVYMTVAGLKTAKGKSPNSGELWSGYKVGKHGKEAIFDFDEAQGGEHVGRSEGKTDESWVKLHTDIVANKDDVKKREAIVDQFFTDHFTPQPGDQMIVKRSTNSVANSFTKADPDTKKGGGQSHTTMIERVEGRKIYTIEGNAGKRVQGRVYDLTDPTDSGKIVFISRFSLANFGNQPNPKKPAAPYEGPIVSEAELLAPIDKLGAVLLSFAQSKGYVQALKPGQLDTVNNLKQGGGTAGPGE